MPEFYQAKEGQVSRIDLGGDPIPASIDITTSNGSNIFLQTEGFVVINSYSLKLMTSHQFVKALDRIVYLFNFGDEMGILNISGLVFPGDCGGVNSQGLQDILTFYKNNKVSADSETVPFITITFASSEVFRGYLTSMSMGVQNPETLLNTFSMEIRTL